ncbi:MAG: preprotein translocase subunit YajC [FCB group bacterium]|nr:preprotein translocase subunit YajC [FCB group bacterium]
MWTIAWAQGATTPTPDAPPPGFMGGSGTLMFMLVFFAIFYFLLIRPNQKREKERQRMLASLSKGSRVVTSGGIIGTIVGLTDKTAVLRVDDNPVVKMEFLRGAISRVITREDENLDS